VEAKTGYGLDLAQELRHLAILRRVDALRPTRVVPTFLGAHALPPEFAGRSAEYIDVVVNEMLPAVAESEGASVFVDIFCDEGAFTREEAQRVLSRAVELGLRVKAHSDEFANLGCTALAAELGATSVDHLVKTTPSEMDALARSGTVAVLLPGTTLGLGSAGYAPARELIARGVPVALGTDLNPGTCPSPNLALVMAVAARYLKMSTAEALVAFTRNAAYASGCGDEAGQLRIGRRADVTVFETDDYRDVAYEFGGNPVWGVMIDGSWAVTPEELAAT
jgi:imidazolonepropionase